MKLTGRGVKYSNVRDDGFVVKKVVLAAKQMGLLVTEAQAREAIACVNDDYVINVFTPATPVPDLPRATIDRYAESLLDRVNLMHI